MTDSSTLQRQCRASLLAAMFLVGGSAYAEQVEGVTSESKTISVYSMEQIADALEAAYDVPITYEDPEPSGPPQNTGLTYWKMKPDSTLEQRKTLVVQSLEAHAGEIFSIIEGNGGFHVVPKKSVLDTPITFEAKPRTTVEAIAEICRAASAASDHKITPEVEDGMPYDLKTSIGASNESARSMLDRLFKEIQSASDNSVPLSLSWRVRCGGAFCQLNVHPVPKTGANAKRHPITVNDLRPVAKAIEKLETIYLLPITYEDPLRINDWEKIADGRGRMVPKFESLSFTYEELPSGVAQKVHESESPCGSRECVNQSGALKDETLDIRKKFAGKAVAELLRSDANAHGAEMFTLVEVDNGLHVVPIRFINQSGQAEETKAVLDTPISIPPGKRTMGEFLDEVLKALTAVTGQKFYDASEWQRWCATTTMGVSDEPARSVLDRFFAENKVGYASLPGAGGGVYDVPSSMSWELGDNYNPERRHGLRYHIVTPENRSPVGMGPPCNGL